VPKLLYKKSLLYSLSLNQVLNKLVKLDFEFALYRMWRREGKKVENRVENGAWSKIQIEVS
jgi:hypothetical protein